MRRGDERDRAMELLVGKGLWFGSAGLWREVPFAHKGLHGAGVKGNTIGAFRAAIHAGYGIEMDVQRCRDELVVLHDRRVMWKGEMRRVRYMTRAQLRQALGEDAAPTLTEAIKCVSGRVPVALDIKCGPFGANGMAHSIERALFGYAGPWCAMSFNPYMVKRMAICGVPRGLLAAGFEQMHVWCGEVAGKLLSNLALCRVAMPDFVALECDSRSRGISAWRARGGQCAVWTLTRAEQVQAARRRSDIVIFEGEGARAAVDVEFAGRWDVLRAWTGHRPQAKTKAESLI